MFFDGRPVPIYGPLLDDEGSAPRKFYEYELPIRVVSHSYNPESREFRSVLDFTLPVTILKAKQEELKKELGADFVHLEPMAMRSYEIILRGAGPDQELTSGETGGPNGTIAPTNHKSIVFQVPETMVGLRRLLEREPEYAMLQVRCIYEFERVTFYHAVTAMTGRAWEVVKEIVQPSDPGHAPSELWVDRAVLGDIMTRLAQAMVHYFESNDLDPMKLEAIREKMNQQALGSFGQLQLPAHDLIDLLDRSAGDKVFTVANGKVEALPILTRDQLFEEVKDEENFHKAKEALRAIQDVFREHKDDRKAHHELREKFNGRGKTSASFGIFGGSLSLSLNKETDQLSDVEWKRFSESREYFLNDSDRLTEAAAKLHYQRKGVFETGNGLAKTLQVYRIDERGIGALTRAVVSWVEIGDVEDHVSVSELPLRTRPHEDFLAITKHLQELQTKNNALTETVERQARKIAQLRKVSDAHTNDLAAANGRLEKGEKKLVAFEGKLSGFVGDIKALKDNALKVTSFDATFGIEADYPYAIRIGPTTTSHVFPQQFGKEVRAVQWEAVNNPYEVGRRLGLFNLTILPPNRVKIDVNALRVPGIVHIRFHVWYVD